MPKTRKTSLKSTPASGPIVAETAPASPPKKSGKRKAKNVMSDSDAESKAVVSHRKKMRTSQSPPGSTAFNRLSPVTITQSSAALESNDTIQFGSTSNDDVLPVTPTPSSKRKLSRSKATTEKDAKDGDPVPISVERKKKVKSDDAVENDTAEPVKKKARDAGDNSDHGDQAGAAFESDDSVPDPGKALAGAFVKKAEASDSDGDSVISISSSEDDDGEAVTAVEYQDPELVDIYKDLPVIKPFRDVVPWSRTATESVDRIEFSTLRKTLSESALASVRCGLTFVRSSFYVNMSRIDPRKLTVELSRVKLNGKPSSFVVGIMLGMVTESALTEEINIGSSMSPYFVRKVSIVPFSQEMRRDTSVWGQLYKFDIIPGPISEMGVSFSTKKRVETPVSSPKKVGLFKSYAPKSKSTSATASASTSTSTTAKPSTSSVPIVYPPAKSCNDPIPIYDGRESGDRKAFAFTDEDFAGLNTRRLYKGGGRDLDDRCMVAVGYTLGTYLSKTQERTLSCNVQFVILLGKTSAIAERD